MNADSESTSPGAFTSARVPRAEGMHQRTFQRLNSEVREAEMCADERLTIFLERLKQVKVQRGIRIGDRSGKGLWA